MKKATATRLFLAAFAASARKVGAVIEQVECAKWIPRLRNRLPQPYPPIFDTFVSSYAFLPFTYGGVAFYANTGEEDYEELGVAIFRDRGLFEGTAPHGFLQFARPEDGSYDPVCFDLNRCLGDDAPIVRLDHEAILCDFAISICARIAPSFRELANAKV